jgi:hypothetical protein
MSIPFYLVCCTTPQFNSFGGINLLMSIPFYLVCCVDRMLYYIYQISFYSCRSVSKNELHSQSCSCGLLNYLLNTYLLTYLLTHFMEQRPSWEANLFLASQEIPHILWTRRFITACTSTCHLSLPWARSIQSMPPHPTSWRSILIVSSHLCLGLPSGLFASGFTT